MYVCIYIYIYIWTYIHAREAARGADQNDIRRAPRNRIAINYLLLLLIE